MKNLNIGNNEIRVLTYFSYVDTEEPLNFNNPVVSHGSNYICLGEKFPGVDAGINRGYMFFMPLSEKAYIRINGKSVRLSTLPTKKELNLI